MHGEVVEPDDLFEDLSGGSDGELKSAAAAFASALPASVTLPAGAGKTHLLAAAARTWSPPAARCSS
jgi:hypothetical protein